MPESFEVSRGKNGQVHFNLLASNRRVILTSEAYKQKRSALNGIASVKKNAKKRDNFEKRTAKNGKHYFVLLAHNGEIVGQSQMYAHASSAYLGIRSVRVTRSPGDCSSCVVLGRLLPPHWWRRWATGNNLPTGDRCPPRWG